MNGRSTLATGPRLVLLVRGPTAMDGDLRDLHAAGLECVCAPCPYEAAAELLSAPCVALVIDLGLLRTRHLRLIELARGMEVEVLAFGPLPARMSASDLSGVRLTSPGGLATAVQELLKAENTGRGEAEAASVEPRANRTPRQGADEKANQAPEGTYERTRPGDLLTPDELSALLENEP